MNATTRNYLGRIRSEQLRVYAAVDNKLAAIHAHAKGQIANSPALGRARPLECIEAANYVIAAASVCISDIAAQAQAAGALSTADYATITALMGKQRMHQRARCRSRCGVHRHAGRLVDNQQVLVFEHDIEGDVLRR